MKNLRPPQFLGNLYRDMRDRHLLIPAVALVVALVAVPVLLKSHSSATSPPVPVVNASKADNAAVPAVVTQQVGVTKYQKRLDRLTSKNPFHQQFTAVPKAGQAHVSVSPTGSSTSTSSTSTSTSSTSTPTGTAGLPATSSTSSSPSTGGTSSPPVSSTSPSTGSSPPATVPHTKPTFHLYTYRVSVKVGEPGHLAPRPEVSSLALLPSKARPILSFLEANGKQALFLVSTDVDSVKGDGRCVPKPADCQYIIMRSGDKASFQYAPNGKRYNLVLKDIHAVEIGHKPPAKTSKASGNVDLKPKLPLLGPG
jgi:hypothetical protein